MNTLKDKVAVVTGGNSGIGFATAKEFLARGAQVVITGRNQASIDAAVAALGAGATGILADTANLEHIDALVQAVKGQFGAVDILFINAGVAFFAPIEMATEQHFDAIMNVNFKGAYFTLSKFLPVLKDGAAITVLSSVNASAGMPNSSVYGASKAALNALMRVASSELASRHIRVNAVSPGPISTPIFGKTGLDEATLSGFAQAITNRVPLKRFGQAEEVAKLVTFLSGDDARYLTGSEYFVDGGVHVNAL